MKNSYKENLLEKKEILISRIRHQLETSVSQAMFEMECERMIKEVIKINKELETIKNYEDVSDRV